MINEKEKVIVTEIGKLVQKLNVPEDFYKLIRTLPICATAPLLMFYIQAIRAQKDIRHVVLLYKLYQVMIKFYEQNKFDHKSVAYVNSIMFNNTCLQNKTTAWSEIEKHYLKEKSRGDYSASYLLNKHDAIVKLILQFLPEANSTVLIDYFYWEVEYLLSDYAEDLYLFYNCRNRNCFGDYTNSLVRDYYNNCYRFKLPKHKTLLDLKELPTELFEKFFFHYFLK